MELFCVPTGERAKKKEEGEKEREEGLEVK